MDKDKSSASAQSGVEEHPCMVNGCTKWGSFGFRGRYGQLWFCREHREEGESQLSGK